ncbi:MAG TPA: putative glycoside hydrolase [Ktedonobacteraceae bacterium]
MVKSNLYKFRFLIVIVAAVVVIVAIWQFSSPHSSPKPTPPNVSTTPSPTKYKPGNSIVNNTGTSDSINLMLNFTHNVTDPAAIAKYYSFVWGASLQQVSELRAGNPKILLSYYFPFYRDNGSFDNQNLGLQQNLTYWRSFHPDWILYKCDRSTPAYFADDNDQSDNRVPLDFTNPAVIDWQLQTYAVPASQNGYDAIAADNVDLVNTYGACGVYHNGQWVQLFSGKQDDPKWRNAVLNWLTQMQSALHQLSHPLYLIPNLALGSVSPSDPFTQQIVSHVDGISDESGFTHYGDGNITDTDLLQKFQFIENVQQQHKPYFIIDEVSSTDNAEIQWSLGTYLMCNEGSATLFISLPQDYGSDARYPQYNIPIGNPTDEMYEAQNVYWRDYTGGLVAVNPSSENAYTVTTSSSHYLDTSGNAVSRTFNLPPHSAMILLHA